MQHNTLIIPLDAPNLRKRTCRDDDAHALCWDCMQHAAIGSSATTNNIHADMHAHYLRKYLAFSIMDPANMTATIDYSNCGMDYDDVYPISQCTREVCRLFDVRHA